MGDKKTMLRDMFKNWHRGIPRLIGLYENKTKKKYDLDILEAIYLHALKKEYERNKKNGLLLRDGAFVTTLYDMCAASRLPLYYQEKAIQELENRGLIEYDPLLFDKYDELSDKCVMFMIKIL